MSISCVMNRRSVRRYTEEPISEEHTQALIRAGLCAPSAKNMQPWELIVVRDRSKLDKLGEICNYWAPLKNAPLAIVVAANLDGYSATNPDFFKHDCAACTENILVAAEGLGLGGVWLGAEGVYDRSQPVKEILGIPEDIIPFSVISLGHPLEHPAPHDTFDMNKVHYDSY
jgi:nitroreductase